MKFRAIFTALFAMACLNGGSSGLSDEFRETPFRFLPGVDLGMTGKQLRQARPAATYAPYLGLQEKIPGFTVSYQFPTPTMETSAKDVGPNDRLEGVFISEPFETMEKAESSWRDHVGAVSARHRAPTACESFPAGGMQARWISGSRVLAIGVFPQEPMAASVTNRVIYAVSPAATLKQPAGATKIDCPRN
jgi:hypothetical protein